MKRSEPHNNEQLRLNELNTYSLKGIEEEVNFDFITSTAAHVCGTKISLLSLQTTDEQLFLSKQGLKAVSDLQDHSFWTHIKDNPSKPLIIEDTRSDKRFSDQSLTIGSSNIVFYAGIPILNPNGYLLGTLSIIDTKSNKLNEEQLKILKSLAQQVTQLLEHRKSQAELKIDNQQLKSNNQLLRKIQKTNQIGVWEMIIATGETTWSDMVHEIHEVPLDFDHNKANAIEFYHPKHRPIVIDALTNCIEKNEPFDVNCILITAKNNQKWVRSTGWKAGGKVIGSFQDITEIKENELKFKGIFNSSLSFIGFLNRDGVLLDVNDTAVDVAKIKHSDVIGKYFWDCYWWQISKETRVELKANFKKALSGESVSYEVAVWIANKTPATILFSLKPIFDKKGNVIYVIPEGRIIQDLVYARRKFKSVIKGTDIGTWEWNIQTGDTIFNNRWAEIVGYTLDELAPVNIETWNKLVHPEDLKKSNKLLQECFEGKTDYYEVEVRMKHKSGNWVWVYSRGNVFEWKEDGSPLMMFGIHQEITERKRNEEALRVSEEAFRGNFENAAIGMALLDKEGRWLKVNDEVCKIVGYTREELIKLTFQDITHPDDLDIDVSLLTEMIEGKRNHYQMEKRYFHKDGHTVYILLSVSMVKDVENNILYFISQIVDLSKRKEAELKLTALLAENKALMDATTKVALISTDKDGIIKSNNIGTEKLLGFEGDKAIGESIRDLIFVKSEWEMASTHLLGDKTKEHDDHKLFNELSHLEGEDFKEWSLKKDNGTLLPVILSVSEIKKDKKGYLFAASDISHILSMQEQLEQKNEELEQFAHVAAHDLKEPLRGITTYLSILLKRHGDELSDKANSYIENATNNATRMKNLISDILDFSKTGSIGSEEVDLDKVLNLIFKNYQKDETLGSIKLSKSKLPKVKGDTSTFIQLFTNLIDNAIKYQPEENNVEVDIDFSENEKFYKFSVADNGIGIEPRHEKRVFEIFKRLHSNSQYTGTGIGLATCKKIISAYGGKIWFEPNKPQGTIFIFTIPKKS